MTQMIQRDSTFLQFYVRSGPIEKVAQFEG